MKKILISFLTLIFYTSNVFCQLLDIRFEKEKDTILRQETILVYPISIIFELDSISDDERKKYTLKISVDEEKSDFPKSGYLIHFDTVSLQNKLKKYTFFITIKSDSLQDRNRNLYLNLELSKINKTKPLSLNKKNSTFNLTIGCTKSLNKYNYLAYIGTNFDLVDGIKAKDLFFATNNFVPPELKKSGFGFNMTLYGNRTLSLNDNLGVVRYTSSIKPIGGDSIRIFKSEGKKTINAVSDNLGASFSPIIRIGKISDPSRNTQLYLAPQFEFIFRRKKITTSFTNINLLDSSAIANRPISNTIIITPENETIPINIYDIYMGIFGLMLKHENNNISIRLQTSSGVTYTYTAKRNNQSNSLDSEYERKWNFSCFLRAWITEPISGITFGAEVTNNLFKKNSSLPYYNVTLSKAIKLSALSAFFAPLTTRTSSPN